MKILVLEALGLHLGYLGCYGNDWVATPNLDRLAAEGIVFDCHIADQPDLQSSLPLHQRSAGTGCYTRPGQSAPSVELPAEPRVLQCPALEDFADRVSQEMSPNDSWTWIEGPSLLPPWSLDDDLLNAYFDEDDVEEGLTPLCNPPLEQVKLDDAAIVRLQNTYAAAVTFFDAQLGKLLEHLPNRNDLVICVTARSGLPLGEHGMIGAPLPLLHNELVHIPLVMRLPKADQAGLRIAALTQPVDLAPTFLEYLGQPQPPVHGCSLWPLIRGDVDAVRPYAVSMMRIGDRENWLLRTLDRALHVPISPRDGDSQRLLFVKPDDRWEVNSLYQHEIDLADAMEKALAEFAEGIAKPGPLALKPIEVH